MDEFHRQNGSRDMNHSSRGCEITCFQTPYFAEDSFPWSLKNFIPDRLTDYFNELQTAEISNLLRMVLLFEGSHTHTCLFLPWVKFGDESGE